MKNEQGICATLYRRNRQGLKRLIFHTEIQNDVENWLAQNGISANQYWLSFVPINRRKGWPFNNKKKR